MVPVLDVGTGSRPTRTDAIVAGFYVNWADNSFASLKRNYDKLDWVIGEWAFIPSNADTLLLRVKPQVIELLHDRPPETRPSLHHAEQFRRHRQRLGRRAIRFRGGPPVPRQSGRARERDSTS